MKSRQEGCLLRIFCGESDKTEGKLLYEFILHKARELKLAGCTVLRGSMGFGAKSHMHTAKLLCLSEDLPIVIEIIDQKEKLEAFLPYLEAMGHDLLITMAPVEMLRYTKA